MQEDQIPNTNSAVILVVDDLPSARRVVARLMQKAGFPNTVEAVDGACALEILRTQKIDVVVSDWQMPGSSGIELLKAVRSDEALKKLPFIMITSTSDKDDVIEALKVGVSDYITKPFDGALLAEKIRSNLAKLAG